MQRALVCLLVLGAAACPAPTDFTPLIRVDPRAAQRLSLLAGTPGPAAVEATSKRARVHVMKDGEQLGGPNAIGRPGDLVLENDEVVFVVDRLGQTNGFAESGGNLVDAADARARKDELGQVFTYFGTFPRQALYDALSSRASPDGSAFIEAKGREIYEATLAVTTRYTLHAPDRALLLETTLENTGTAPLELPSLGDAIQWGGAEKVAPGKPPGFKGASSGPYVGGVGRFVSYAVTSTEGAIEGVSGGGWTDTAQTTKVTLAPGGKASYARVLVVGERADSSSLVGELAMTAGQPVGEIAVRFAGGTLGTGEGLGLRIEGGERLSLAAPFAARVPVGRYAIDAAGVAGRTIDVAAEGVARLELQVEPRARVAVGCKDDRGEQAACKVTFEGVPPTPNPDFGLAHAAGPARNQVTTAGEAVAVLAPPGKYRVTASRGPEYALASVDLDASPGQSYVESLAPRRVVDTSGYLGCDFHQHTTLSADSGVATRDRVVANAAEGVEVAVATEHNVVADLEPIVREMRLDRALVEITGDELTSDASRHPWGHVNVFPIPFDPTRPRGGAVPVRDRTAHEVLDDLRRSIGPSLVVQVNHARRGSSGYFDRMAFDRARGAGSDPGYDAGFDALEVWNGRNGDGRDKLIDDWRALLRTGHPVTATANSDTHGVVGQEAGYPRTYVRVGDDAHLDAWDAARTDDLGQGLKARRDVVLTNGPMLRVSANGAPIGGVAKGHRVIVKVHVECAPWVDVDTVQVVRASEGGRETKRAVKLTPLASGARGADATLVVAVEADDAIFVVASGQKPMTPVLAGDAPEISPLAMTGAIWVDADGDGRALGR